MARAATSTPRTTLLILILIVGCGLILSLIRMSKMPSAYSTSRQYISSLVNKADNSHKLSFANDGPTIFKDDYEQEQKTDPTDQPSKSTLEPDQGSVTGSADETSTSPPEVPEPEGEKLPETNPETITEAEPSTEKSTEKSTAGSKEPVSGDDKPTQEIATQTQSELINNVIPEETAARTRPVHVLLLTEGRSGSTWLSSFFWNRKEVYYTFEPLYETSTWKKHNCSDPPERRKKCDQEVLSNFWKCDFHTSELSVLGRYPSYKIDCSATPKLCTIEGREAACGAATHRVAKTIRLWDLTNIEEIVRNTAEYDVRVIHLVRDPRPLLNSRSKYGFGSLDGIHKHNDFDEESFEEQCATVCNRMLEQSQLGDNPPDWLKNKYVRITHERLSLRPIETAMMLYKFVELPWTRDTQEYIYNTTIGEIGKSGMYGIGKVSTDVINKWKMMKEEKIQKITDACYDAIKYLGYESDMEKIRQWRKDNAELFANEDSTDKNENNESSNSNENR